MDSKNVLNCVPTVELGYTMDPRPLGAREKDREITGLILLNVMEKLYVLDGLLLRIFSKHDRMVCKYKNANKKPLRAAQGGRTTRPLAVAHDQQE